MEAIGKLTIFFAITGATTGLISGIITSADITLNHLAPFIALLLFYISYKLATHPKFKNDVLKISGEFPGKSKKVVMTGFWPHFIVWLLVWVMVYTLLVAK